MLQHRCRSRSGSFCCISYCRDAFWRSRLHRIFGSTCSSPGYARSRACRLRGRQRRELLAHRAYWILCRNVGSVSIMSPRRPHGEASARTGTRSAAQRSWSSATVLPSLRLTPGKAICRSWSSTKTTTSTRPSLRTSATRCSSTRNLYVADLVHAGQLGPVAPTTKEVL